MGHTSYRATGGNVEPKSHRASILDIVPHLQTKTSPPRRRQVLRFCQAIPLSAVADYTYWDAARKVSRSAPEVPL